MDIFISHETGVTLKLAIKKPRLNTEVFDIQFVMTELKARGLRGGRGGHYDVQ